MVVPTTLGDGNGEPASSPASSAPRPAPPPAPPPPRGSQPDPEPLRQAEQYEYELEWNEGELNVLSVTSRKFPKPVVTARKIGRFAIELWIGSELVERVRFDLPLLGAEETGPGNSARPAPPSLEKGARVRQRVLVPAAERARRAVLVDRATSKETPLPWPPPSAPASARTE